MFKITIEAASLAELQAQIATLAGLQQGNVETPPVVNENKPARAPRKAETKAEPLAASDETDRELLADVPPAPATANTVVDAGTGKAAVEPETKKVTMDDIRKAATDLAAKDTAKLASLIKANGGTKLSDIPPANLPAFAAAVFEAVG